MAKSLHKWLVKRAVSAYVQGPLALAYGDC